MYRLDNERAAVREIQKYLHFISDRIYPEIPRLAIDGFYGEETKEGVKAYQRIKGLNESGAVDFESFTLMYEDYLKAKLLYEAESYFIDDSLFPFKRGDLGREVLYINLMLDELSHLFSELGRVDLKPYYSLSTENAVKEIRKIFLMEEDVVIDICLFERMRRELSVRGKNNIW